MFEPSKKFYMTKAIVEELSLEHQYFILKYISENHEQLTDYLQIFEFYTKNSEQWLKQRQEEPEQETTIHIKLITAKPIHRKVWVMDQADHVMILFPEDY